MAVLSDTDREKIQRGLSRYWSTFAGTETTPWSHAALRTAVNETDAWIDDNQADYVAALSGDFASNSTAAQKTLLFCIVAAMRVSPEFARKLAGDLD